MVRPLAILITLVVVAHAALGGLHGSVVLCIGSHGDANASTPAGTAGCDHGHGVPAPAHDDDHDGSCCGDIQLTLAEILALPRFDDGTGTPMPPAMVECRALVPVASGASWRGPPSPPWADSARDHRLVVVACTHLTL